MFLLESGKTTISDGKPTISNCKTTISGVAELPTKFLHQWSKAFTCPSHATGSRSRSDTENHWGDRGAAGSMNGKWIITYTHVCVYIYICVCVCMTWWLGFTLWLVDMRPYDYMLFFLPPREPWVLPDPALVRECPWVQLYSDHGFPAIFL